MDINDRLRGAFDEYAAADPKPSISGQAARWRINVYLLRGALALHELLPLREDEEVEPALHYRPRADGGTGRPRSAVAPDQAALVTRARMTLGKGPLSALAERVGVPERTMRRYLRGQNALPAILRQKLLDLTGKP